MKTDRRTRSKAVKVAASTAAGPCFGSLNVYCEKGESSLGTNCRASSRETVGGMSRLIGVLSAAWTVEANFTPAASLHPLLVAR